MSAAILPQGLERDLSDFLARLPGLCPEATPTQLECWGEQMHQYVALLYAWSGRMNLVSSRDRSKLASRHLLPSLAMRQVLIQSPHSVVADLGSGSGLPGIPLKISLPDAEFQLIEARRRRASFLREVTRRLGLSKVEVINARAEDWSCPEPRRPDVVVSRASMPPDLLLKLSMGLVKAGGRVLYSPASDQSARASLSPQSHIVDTGIADVEGRAIRVGVLCAAAP